MLSKMEKMMNILLFGLLYLCCTSVHSQTSDFTETNGTCKGPEACVYEHIFAGYNKLTRPIANYNETIKVQIEFVFNSLMDIEERDEIMRIVGFFRAFWHDEMLIWNPEDYGGVKSLTVPADTIWLPDIGITNSVSRFYEVTYKRDFHLQVRHTGNIRWSFGGILTTSCDIDLTYYPFDHQRCDIELESWQYQKEKISLELYPGNAVDQEEAGDDPQWILVEATGERYLKYSKRFSGIKYTLHWVRKPLYFYVNIIIPGAYMAMITLGVFWLPIGCGEKMSLGITVVLAFSVFQIVIMEITPVSSDSVPQITEMVIMVMSLATASLLSSMFVSYLSDYDTPPPRWVKKVFLYYIPMITRMSSFDIYKDEMTGKKAQNNKDPEGKCMTGEISDQYLLEEKGRSRRTISEKKRKQENTSADNDEQNRENSFFAGKQIQYVGLEQEERGQIEENIKEILSLLKRMKGRYSDEDDTQKIKEYWRYVGMAFDRMVFWICFIVFTSYLIYALVNIRLSQYHSENQ